MIHGTMRVTGIEGDRFTVALTDFEDEPFTPLAGEKFLVSFHLEGYKVSSYYASTILEHVGGLNLEGSEPAWSINAGEMDKVRSWVRTFC